MNFKSNFISGASPWFINAKASEVLERLNRGHFVQNAQESDREANENRKRVNYGDIWGPLHDAVNHYNLELVEKLIADGIHDIYRPRRGYDMYSILHSLVYNLLHFDRYLSGHDDWIPTIVSLTAILVEHGALYNLPIAECVCIEDNLKLLSKVANKIEVYDKIKPGKIYFTDIKGRKTVVRIECIYNVNDPRLDKKIQPDAYEIPNINSITGYAIAHAICCETKFAECLALYPSRKMEQAINDINGKCMIPHTLEQLVTIENKNENKVDTNYTAHLYPYWYRLKPYWKAALKSGFEQGHARRLQRSKACADYLIPILGSAIVLQVIEPYSFLIPRFTRPEETTIRLSCCEKCRLKKISNNTNLFS